MLVFKRVSRLGAVLALAAAAALSGGSGQTPSSPVTEVYAQNAGATLFVPLIVKRSVDDSTALFVQNISPAPTVANVTFYDLNGLSNPAWTLSAPIGPGESHMWDLGLEAALPMGFDGSAVVQSAQPIAAVLNRTMGGALGSPTDLRAAQARASADGFSIAMSEPGTQGILPVVFGGYHGYYTTISLQNTGTVPGTYTIALYPTGMPSPIASIPRALPPATAARVILGPESGVPPDFVGTAVISASASTLTAAAETMQPDSGVLMSYGDLHAGATAMNVPLLFKNYHGWVSGAQVVNMSSSPVVVNADIFQRDTPLSFGLGARTLAPNESFTYYLPGMGQLPDDFVGSGSFSANGPIAVVVQQLNDERGEAMVYSGFSGGTPNLGAPVIFRGSNGWDSGVQVQNLGAADATVNITYHLPGGGAAVDAALIAAGSSTTFYQADFPGIPVGTIGAATVNSINGQPIVAIVNEVNYMRPGDGSATYVGINY